MYLNEIVKISNVLDQRGLFKIADVLDLIVKFASQTDEDKVKEIFEQTTGSTFERHPLHSKGLRDITLKNDDRIDLLVHHGYVRTAEKGHIKYSRLIPIEKSPEFNINYSNVNDLNSFSLCHGDGSLQAARNFITFYRLLIKWEEFIKNKTREELEGERERKYLENTEAIEATIKGLITQLVDILSEENGYYYKTEFSEKDIERLDQLQKDSNEIKSKLLKDLYNIPQPRLMEIIDSIGEEVEATKKPQVGSAKKMIEDLI